MQPIESWLMELVRPKRIIIVDDDPTIHELLARELRDYNCSITVAVNGEDALAMIRAKEFDLAVIDLKMDGMDGADLFREVRRHDEMTPIVIFSAHLTQEKVQEISQIGFCLFVLKPQFIDVEFVFRFCHLLGIKKRYCSK